MHSVIDQIYYSQELSLNQTLELGETLRGQPMINSAVPPGLGSPRPTAAGEQQGLNVNRKGEAQRPKPHVTLWV